jgi:hypothetical protein
MKFTHLSPTKIEKFKTPTNLGKSFKPSGCLWFACDNTWEEWLDKELLERYKYTYHAKLDIHNLIVLKTKKDIEEFSKQFAIPDTNYISIDWNRVRRTTGKGGIYIVNPSIKSARLEYTWYSSFDVCSVAVWNKEAILEMISV